MVVWGKFPSVQRSRASACRVWFQVLANFTRPSRSGETFPSGSVQPYLIVTCVHNAHPYPPRSLSGLRAGRRAGGIESPSARSSEDDSFNIVGAAAFINHRTDHPELSVRCRPKA